MTERNPRAWDDVTDTPCPTCARLAREGKIQSRGVMPLPKLPARLRADGTPCCRDCQATETSMQLGNHPHFSAARLTVSNERVEGTLMPPGMMEHFGLCKQGFIRPSSLDDFERHIEWLFSHGIPNSCYRELFVDEPHP